METRSPTSIGFAPNAADTSRSGVYVLNIQSGRSRLVFGATATSVDWSRDGQSLAISTPSGIYRYDFADNSLLSLSGTAYFARWFPTGDSISMICAKHSLWLQLVVRLGFSPHDSQLRLES